VVRTFVFASEAAANIPWQSATPSRFVFEHQRRRTGLGLLSVTSAGNLRGSNRGPRNTRAQVVPAEKQDREPPTVLVDNVNTMDREPTIVDPGEWKAVLAVLEFDPALHALASLFAAPCVVVLTQHIQLPESDSRWQCLDRIACGCCPPGPKRPLVLEPQKTASERIGPCCEVATNAISCVDNSLPSFRGVAMNI
jgi:hypothetical protein